MTPQLQEKQEWDLERKKLTEICKAGLSTETEIRVKKDKEQVSFKENTVFDNLQV